MNGPLQWQRWALKQGELWRLTDGEARLLSVLAAHVNRDGLIAVDFLTEAEMAKRVQRSERTVRRLLGGLRKKGLISTKQRGRDVARHQLHDVLPVDQLTLDSEPFDRPKMTGRPTGQPVTAMSYQTGHLGDRQENEERVVVVADARDGEHQHPHDSGVLDERFAAVVEVLEALPSPYRHFEPAAVESALRAYPDRDAVAAAHIVASKVHGRQTHTVHVNTLLMGVLSRMKPNAEPQTAGGAASSTAAKDAASGKWWDGALNAATQVASA